MVFRLREIIDQIKNDVKVPKRPLDVYEFDKRIYLIDIPLKRTVKGIVNGKENILTFNFWAYMFGLLGDFNAGGAVDVNDRGYNIRGSGDPQGGSAYLVYGTDSTPEDITQNKLLAYAGSISTTATFGTLSDRFRITFSGVVPSNAAEIGIYQPLLNEYGMFFTTMLARKALSVSANQTVNYYIDFFMPWTYNWALAMYGYLTDSSPSGVVDELGYLYQVRTWADANADQVLIRVSSKSYTWSPDLTTISADFEIRPYLKYDNFRNLIYLFIIGNAIPSNDIQVNTVALMQPMFDTSGNVRNTYVLILPLSTPATLYKNRNNMIFIRLIAM